MDDLKDKVVLITGSSSGIGAATAMDFAQSKARVAVHYNSHAEQAHAVLAGVRAAGGDGDVFHADVADTAQLERLAADVCRRFGRIDILVNNAGGFIRRC